MNKVLTILIASISVLFCCNNQKVNIANKYIEEIASLNSNELKKKYLEKVLIDDQKVRGPKGQDLMLQYGKDSKEHMDYIRKQWSQDSINLLKVENYFELYGYPDKALGDKATTAPWMVIHHSQEYGAREANFETIYRAYIDGDIDSGAISFFLGRMYRMKYGSRLEMQNPFTAEDEIEKLITGLELENTKKNVLKNLKDQSLSK